MKIKRLFCTILTAVLMLSMFAAFPKDAYAEDTVSVVRSTATPTRVNYDIKVTVKVTEDADGWNDAWIGINHMYKGGVTDPDYCVLRFTAESGRCYRNLKKHSFRYLHYNHRSRRKSESLLSKEMNNL